MKNNTTSDIYPGLSYNDASAAIEWLCSTFGFEKKLVVPGPDGTIVHSELRFGSSVIMVNSPRPNEQRVSPRSLPGMNQMLSVFVDDPDRHHDAAAAAGAEIIHAPEDTPFGARGYAVLDLEGHRWFFSNYRPGSFWD
jgi:uncharacterized glyoxalase superfamily protein PhnB